MKRRKSAVLRSNKNSSRKLKRGRSAMLRSNKNSSHELKRRRSVMLRSNKNSSRELKRWRGAMPTSHNNFSLRNISLLLFLLLFVSAASVAALGQENTSNDSITPLVYSVENTGANYPTPVFPSFGQLPIIRTLPDPFRFFDGS